MGGRGRGKATLSREQLQSMGALGNDMPPVMMEPPPTYPQLMTRPVPFPTNSRYDEQFMMKMQFKKRMRQKPTLFFNSGTGRGSGMADKTDLMERARYKCRAYLEKLNWKCMPSELYSKGSKVPKKRPKMDKEVPDIEKRLEELAKKETLLEESGEQAAKPKNSDDEEETEREEFEKIATDDEFDGDNDYGNNYFDNGESYDDNADDPDDGPVF